MQTDRNVPPFNPLPPAVWGLVAAVVGVEAALQVGAAGLAGGPEAVGWRLAAIQRFGFSGAIWDWMVETRRFAPADLVRLVTFGFLHQGLLHAGLVAVVLMALGKAVGEALGGWALLVVTLGGAAAGALAYAVLWPEPAWLIGGFPAVFALGGAHAVVCWADPGARGLPARRRLRGLWLVVALLAVRIGAGLWLGVSSDWIADVAAFAAGAGIAALVRPGGWRGLHAWLRAR